MSLGKRQIVLASLVMALGAAVYLNWQFSDSNNLIATNYLESAKELGEAKYVNNMQTESESSSSEKSVKSSNAEVSENKEDYFSQANANRQKARDEATDMVKEILNDIKSSEQAKAEAVKQAADIAKNIQQESNIESLVKSKGFNNCIAFIQNGECSVVVSSDGFDEGSAITIKDIVSGQAGVPFDKIKITEAQ